MKNTLYSLLVMQNLETWILKDLVKLLVDILLYLLFLEDLTLSEDIGIMNVEKEEERDTITLTTIHGAKGGLNGR